MSAEIDVLKDIRRILKKILLMLMLPFETDESMSDLPTKEK